MVVINKMNKNIKGLVLVMLVSLMASSVSAGVLGSFTWSDIGSFVADDSTPAIPFTVTGNNSSYTCNLFLNLSGTWTAAGSVEATNNTLSSVTCNYTLSPWTTYQYNITAYNVSDVPTTFTSTTYTVRYSSFKMLATMVTDISGIFSAMVALVIAIIVILVVMSIGIGLTKGFGELFSTIFDVLRFKK